MNNSLYDKIQNLELPVEIKEALLSIAIDNVYIEYKQIHDIINGLSTKTQNIILELVMGYNKKLYDKEKQIESELRAIQSIRNNISTNDVANKEVNVENSDVVLQKKVKKSEIDIDVNDYLTMINQVENIDNLEGILPNYFTDKYEIYIQKILLELQKDAKDYYDLYITNTDNVEKQDYYKELKSIQEKINYIIDYHQEQMLQNEDIELEDAKVNNKIIFLKTESGTPYALKDLKTIDPTYYESFNSLLKSIENGTFKNFKSFNSNNLNINNASEVRGFKTRIIFDRISNDTYIILRLLVKKINNDTYYQTALFDRVNSYRKQKEEIQELLDNEEFIEENHRICEELKDTFSSKARKGYM